MHLYRAESHNNVYAFDIQLFAEVDVEQSKWNTKGRNIILNIVKKDASADHWPRLTKDKVKNQHIQIDWSKWVDEDEEDEAKPVGEDWDGANMNNFNMGGYDGGDSDDEEEEEGHHHDHEGHDHEGHDHDHEHGPNCSHGHEATKAGAAGLDDLDAEEEDPNATAQATASTTVDQQ
jgi:hypothetical protein